ncbi:uncharacterized protein TRUGW13939_03606 [Talaromyces rugulosus]|uniref:Alpha/beta hydrolase fold-3 domain-containing protein n=1 Tax=Talaromyces rugulosus TaxID=121627 RepID=A0A7H8QSN9_TALRU|nr:uncharacterized protein TRUGW13939_03606 [Talaromyces rugulosus]QKX56501.1 hypothetical protein TRUGW13939_03606 [Talaromyces rugulosus]
MWKPGDHSRYSKDKPLLGLTESAILAASQARVSGVKKQDSLSSAVNPFHNPEDHDIPTRDGTTRIGVYRPKAFVDSQQRGPLIVIYHAGGFCLGNDTMADANESKFHRRFGATCVSVDYRLAPEHQFPAAAHDSWDNLKWVVANPDGPLLTADPTKGFILSGMSAGDTLAGRKRLTAIDEKWKDELLWFEQNKDAPILSLGGVDLLARSYNADIDSPLHNVLLNPTGHTDTPPHFIQVAGLDPVRDTGIFTSESLERNTEFRLGSPSMLVKPMRFGPFCPKCPHR